MLNNCANEGVCRRKTRTHTFRGAEFGCILVSTGSQPGVSFMRTCVVSIRCETSMTGILVPTDLLVGRGLVPAILMLGGSLWLLGVGHYTLLTAKLECLSVFEWNDVKS